MPDLCSTSEQLMAQFHMKFRRHINIHIATFELLAFQPSMLESGTLCACICFYNKLGKQVADNTKAAA